MADRKTAVVGIGATGSVLAAALLKNDPETILVGTRPAVGEALRKGGIRISGALSYKVPVRHFFTTVEAIGDLEPNIIVLATKTYHLPNVIEALKKIFKPGMKIVSAQNGLGTEDLIAKEFGTDAAFRMSLNMGVALQGPGVVEAAFFNKPNPLGGVVPESKEAGSVIAKMFTDGGLDTEYVDDVKLFVWKKMILKCTMASICAVTDKTIKGALEFPPTREIADACFQEALAVAKAKGYDLGPNYLNEARGYLERVGVHKDSMCWDLANKTPTEIDFLGGKIVEYAREKGIPTPYYTTMTNLVKGLENNYLA